MIHTLYLIFVAVKQLKNFVLQNAKKKCTFDGTKIADEKIITTFVPLQIHQYQPNHDSDDTGHLHTRKEIIDRSNISTSSILPENLFKKSQQYILNTSDYINACTKEAKEKVLKEKGNVVGVIGQAGVGKSTLVKNLLHRNVTDEQLYKADFVFYIKLRDFFDKTEINLFQFLMGKKAYNSLEWKKDSVICKDVLKLLSQSESVCILLDGLDEADIDVTHKKVEVDIFGQNSPEHYILGLLSGEILPNAKKLITSRPGQMLDLSDSCKPKFIVKIFGINQRDIQQICHGICDDEYASEVLSCIESQPDLLSYCLVPINCVLTVFCIYRFLQIKLQKSLPKNITDVFVMTFFFFSKTEHMRESLKKFDIKSVSDLEKISKLAWNGIKNQKYCFDDDDLKAAGLINTSISSLTVTLKKKNQESRIKLIENATKKCIYFSHLLLQEFFATVYCLYFMNYIKFYLTFFSPFRQFRLTDNRFEMITKFMFGLSNPKTFETLKEIYPSISEPTKRLKRLQDLATSIASKSRDSIFDRLDDSVFISQTVCEWAYEMQDPKFCEKLAESLPKTLSVKINDFFQSSDYLSFFYVIRTRKTILKLDIWFSSYFISCEPNSLNVLHLFFKEMELLLKDWSNIKVIILIKNFLLVKIFFY